MIILCTHNSGGVGKTTLAIHLTGILASQPGKTTLLIDCDDQADSWRFYTKRMPTSSHELLMIDESISILENHKRKKITTLINVDEYDHIVFDIDTPLKNTIQTIIQNDPEIVFIPISKPHEDKGLELLPKILKTMATLQSKAGFSPEVILVPLGIEPDHVLNTLENIPVKPKICRVAPAIRDVQDKISRAIFKEKQYIWDYAEDCQDLYDDFCSLLAIDCHKS